MSVLDPAISRAMALTAYVHVAISMIRLISDAVKPRDAYAAMSPLRKIIVTNGARRIAPTHEMIANKRGAAHGPRLENAPAVSTRSGASEERSAVERAASEKMSVVTLR